VVLMLGIHFKHLKTQLAIFSLENIITDGLMLKGFEALFLFYGYLGIVICCDWFEQKSVS
jgi:hypothetical protein